MDKSVALVAQKEEEQEMAIKVETAKTTPSRDGREGRPEASKGKGKGMIEEYNSSTQDELADIGEQFAFLSRKFSS